MKTRLKGEGNGPVAWIPRCGAPELSGRVVPLAHGLIQGQFPVPERPGAQAVGCFLGDGGGRDGEYRAPGVGQAVAAHPAAADPGQWATPSCSHDEQVVGGAGGLDQDRTWFASSDDRPDGQARGFSSPRCVERIAEPLRGVLRPDAAQGGRGRAPFGLIPTGRRPGENGYQHGVSSMAG